MPDGSKRWRKNSASPHTTTGSVSPESPGVSSASASSIPPKSPSSGSPANRNSGNQLISPIGFGDTDDPRARLLGLAGYTEATLALAVQKSMEKKLQLLEATKTVTAQYMGKIADSIEVSDVKTQLAAAKALDEVLGVKAPPARQAVTIVHKIELPAWMCPDDQPNQVVDVTGTVEP